MKNFFVFSAITVSSLFASAAFADEPVYPPCNGNFGITYPNRCTPQQPTPVVPDEAFAPAPEVVFIEVSPIQAPEPTPQVEAPCVEAKPMPQLYQPRNAWASQGKFGLFQNANRVREIGMRSLSGDGYGGSLYFRTHRNDARLGLELSVDAVDNVALTQASIVAYSKYQGVIKPFAFVGGGLYIDTPGYSVQAGIGADINITKRLSINIDARYMVAEEAGYTYYDETSVDCLDCYYDYEQSFDGALFSVGLGWKFGALGKQEKTLLQGKLLGSTANAFRSSASQGFSTWPNQSKYTYSQRWSQKNIAPWNQGKQIANWNEPQTTAAPKQGGFLKSVLKSPVDSYGLVREVGVRSFTDFDDGGSDTGGGLYFKTYRNGGRIGGEASLDAIGSDILVQGSILGYLNPKGTVRPYGIIGVGSELTSSEFTAQWGAGLDVSISKRFSLNADLRGIQGAGSYSTLECDANGFCGDSFNNISAFVGGLGVGYKF